MTKFLFLPLFFLLSCISEPTKVTDTTRETVPFQPITNIEDNERVKAVCKALANKENVLSTLSNSNTTYTYSFSQKGCNEPAMPAAKDVVVAIRPSGTGYGFKPTNGESFGFPDIETATEGVMADICKFGGTLESPIRAGSTGATWWTTFSSSEHCTPGFGTLCIYLQRGNSVDGNNYKIHTNEWIKFKLYDNNEGFFTERKLVSSAGCKSAKSGKLEMRAILK
jgi:hypothetical protein